MIYSSTATGFKLLLKLLQIPSNRSIKMLNIYLAGKISKNDWRHQIVNGLRRVSRSFFGYSDINEIKWPILKNSIFKYFHYTGPYFIGCDHGCFHDSHSHGWANEGDCGDTASEDSYYAVYELCKTAIHNSDLVFAWIDSTESYGTFAEIGYAAGLKKTIVTAFEKNIPDLWFINQMGNGIICPTPTSALRFFLEQLTEID